MAYCKIVPIKAGVHLKNSLEYIQQDKKTNNKILTDSYGCTFKYAESDFELERVKAVINKGNNVAWHITQSFSPEDNITPEQAHEIGKKLMEKMYPDFQYVIATHVDKNHIHNHIIMNSVSFENHHKLHSNFKSLRELRNINDILCSENGLSVIDKNTKSQRIKLAGDIEKAIKSSGDYYDFITNMQRLGWTIKSGKELSFKNDKMERYISPKSISYEYAKDMIIYKISKNKGKSLPDLIIDTADNSEETKAKKRTVYDDKIKYRSKRQRLKAEIDSSIKKAATFEEFIEDMQRKNFKYKTGARPSFINSEFMERYFRLDKLGEEYTEQCLRYRIEHKYEYEKIKDNTVKRVISHKDKYGGLDKWAYGENTNRKLATDNWVQDNVLHGADYGYRLNYFYFIEYYNEYKNELENIQSEIVNLEKIIKECTAGIKTINEYYRLKPIIESYGNKDVNLFSEKDQAKYKSDLGKWSNVVAQMNNFKLKHGTVSIKNISALISEQQQRKNKLLIIEAERIFELQNLKNIKYNYEASYEDGGLSITNITNEEVRHRQEVNYQNSESRNINKSDLIQ